jgi:hypothetical protein
MVRCICCQLPLRNLKWQMLAHLFDFDLCFLTLSLDDSQFAPNSHFHFHFHFHTAAKIAVLIVLVHSVRLSCPAPQSQHKRSFVSPESALTDLELFPSALNTHQSPIAWVQQHRMALGFRKSGRIAHESVFNSRRFGDSFSHSLSSAHILLLVVS